MAVKSELQPQDKPAAACSAKSHEGHQKLRMRRSAGHPFILACAAPRGRHLGTSQALVLPVPSDRAAYERENDLPTH